MGKIRLAKVIFTNISKSGACLNSFDRNIMMIAQCMRNVFTFY